LKIQRIVSFLIISVLLFYYGVEDNSWKFFVYFTHWGMMTTFAFFLFALLNYYLDYLDTTVCTLFLIIWAFNWCVTLAFWGYLVPVSGLKTFVRGTLTHSVPLILTLLDYSFNEIPFIRSRFLISLSVMITYFMIFLLPYSVIVKPIYHGIDFDDVISILITIVVFIIALGILELGKLLKEAMLKSKHSNHSEHQEPLLENGPQYELKSKSEV
jgi:hypothetical protein